MSYLTLAFPLLDADRMTPSGGKGGGRVNARVVVVVVFAAYLAVWLIARLNGYWVR